MKQEFVTLYGKATIEKNILYVRNLDIPFSKTAFSTIGYQSLFVIIFIFQFLRSEGPLYYVRIIVFGMLLAFHVPEIYDLLFKRSYASRIPLDKIKSVEMDEDYHGLQTNVILRLNNGRYRKIPFRKLENQYEAFVEAIMTRSRQPQLV